ncbi:unnamed protein product [Spirodela intermedia]|uniref:Calcium-transporting ATPase n=1 Tax=Spirodela intermedia TaxID=51605 RepID=A0A7I8JXG6_SPIIN|nr:unnamed protein product [Spirodela intermedia]
MENLLKDFEVPPKKASEEALRRWRKAAWVVKNPARRYRFVADLDKRSEGEAKRLKIQERLRVCLYVHKAALTFIDAVPSGREEYTLPEEFKRARFLIHPDELASVVGQHDFRRLKTHGHLDGICKQIRSSLSEGIITDDLSVRQQLFGFNKYEEKPSRTLFMFFIDALRDLTLIILIICAVVSITVGLATDGWPEGLYDGLGIVLCILLVIIVTAVSDYKQSLQFRDLDNEKKKILVQVTRDGYRQTIFIHDLVVGDVVHLSIGDQVPADGLFISGYSLSVDESSLTGESEPVNVSTEKPFLLAGTKVQDGSAKMLVTSVGMKTEWGRLTETLNQGGEDETPLQVKLNGVATIIGKIGLGFAILTFLVLLARFLIGKAVHGGILHWSFNDALSILNYFSISVTIIVVAVPEGLPLAVTLSLAFAMKKLMNDKALVRHLSACETMGSASSICTDKTGTLTTNHMVVNKIWICDVIKSSMDVCKDLSSVMSETVLNILIQCIFQNTSSEVCRSKEGKMTILGSPTEKALMEFALNLGGDFDARFQGCEIIKVEPFNSVKKKMFVLVSLKEGGFRAFCKGASETVLQMCDRFADNAGNCVPLSENKANEIMDVVNSFACGALRTLCIAFKDIERTTKDDDIPANGYTLVAVFGIKDPVRPGVKEAVETCISAGITVRMVTGDNINTAKAIAKECGILTDGGLAIEGPVFREKSAADMEELIPKIQVMARSSPTDKHLLVNHLRKMYGEVVAVTGDGTNDAPALHEADIGLAMGTGTEVAKENADVIVMDDNFTTIINVAKWGRAVYRNIQKFVQFQLTVNIVALILNFVSACVTGTTPLTAVQLLWVNMIMDTLGALALATEPPNEEMMRKPPVKRGADFITKIMWRNILGQVVYQLVVLGVLMFDGKRLLNISGSDASSILNTFIFNTFVFCQVFNEINSLEMESINVFPGIFRSWMFVAIISSTVVFQVIIVEFLGTLASTVPLSWQLWLVSVLIGSVSMIAAVILKCIPVERGNRSLGDGNGYQPLPTGPEGV